MLGDLKDSRFYGCLLFCIKHRKVKYQSFCFSIDADQIASAAYPVLFNYNMFQSDSELHESKISYLY